MTEEEKKAYDNLLMLKYFTMEKEDKESIGIILKLIDKQDTEINKLKKEKEYYKKLYNESYNFLDPKFTGDHIPRID